MNDPKYDAGAVWHKVGKYKLPVEEPVMLLRGKDPVALKVMKLYLMACDKDHYVSCLERVNAFEAYQSKYPERVGVKCTEGVKFTEGLK